MDNISMFAGRCNRTGFVGGVLVCTALTGLLLAVAPARGAGGGPGAEGDAVRFEPIAGTKLKRVILTAKGAERLGIETAKVTEETIVLKQMFGGQVTHPLRIEAEQKLSRGDGGFGFTMVAARPVPKAPTITAEAAAAQGTWVRLMLSQEEWDRIAQNRPARVLPLNAKPGSEITAGASKLPPFHDMKRTMLAVYYVVPGQDHVLEANERVRIELELKGSGKKGRVIPYSALYYDDKGQTWVYAVPKPLVYERHRVKVDRIIGKKVVIDDGPPVGTEVVSIGAALLYGAEVIFKK